MSYFVSPDACKTWGQTCDKCENRACLSREKPLKDGNLVDSGRTGE